MVLPLSGERNTVEYSCLKVWIKTEIVSDNLIVYPGGGGGLLPYMGHIGICRGEGYDFQAVYSGIGYINQRVCV